MPEYLKKWLMQAMYAILSWKAQHDKNNKKSRVERKFRRGKQTPHEIPLLGFNKRKNDRGKRI